MDVYFKLLESYRGRDQILRLCTFAALTGAGTLKGESARRLQTIASQIGEARTVLRLFDGLPMLKRVLHLGLASHEKHTVTRLLTLLSTWAMQLFYPFELLAWSGKYKVLPVKNPSLWAVLSVSMWFLYLLAQILKSLIKIPGIVKTMGKLRKQKVLDPAEGGSADREQNDVIHWSLRELQYELRTEYLSLVQHISSVMNAGNWMPKGWFWSGKLSLTQNGVFGLISTIIMLYSNLRTPPAKQN